jgi:hypothetical protein
MLKRQTRIECVGGPRIHVTVRSWPPPPADDDEDWDAAIARAKVQAASLAGQALVARPASPKAPGALRRPPLDEWEEMQDTPPPPSVLPGPTLPRARLWDPERAKATLDALHKGGPKKPAAPRPSLDALYEGGLKKPAPRRSLPARRSGQ